MPDYNEMAARGLARKMAAMERKLVAALEGALRVIRSDIGELYEKYAVNGVLTNAEMTKYNRLATAEKQIVADLTKATNANLATIRTVHPEMYNEAFFRYAWALDQTTRIELAWGRLNIDAIRENLASPMYKLSLERYGQEARMSVRSALNNGLIRGKGYQAMMRDIRGSIEATAKRAVVILRTEGQRAINAGTDAAYTRAVAQGVDMSVVWVATKDDVTRYDHRAMDGVTRSETGVFTLPNGETCRYPLDSTLSAGQVVNCRCTTRAEVDGLSPQLMRTRDEGVVPYAPYSKWRPG